MKILNLQERMSFITTQAAQASFTEIGSASSRQASAQNWCNLQGSPRAMATAGPSEWIGTIPSSPRRSQCSVELPSVALQFAAPNVADTPRWKRTGPQTHNAAHTEPIRVASHHIRPSSPCQDTPRARRVMMFLFSSQIYRFGDATQAGFNSQVAMFHNTHVQRM